MIRKDFSARRGELFPILLETGQHSEIPLIQYRTAVPLDVAGASALLLVGSAVLCQGGTGKEKRQSADGEDIVVHGNLLRREWRCYLRAAVILGGGCAWYLLLRSSPD